MDFTWPGARQLGLQRSSAFRSPVCSKHESYRKMQKANHGVHLFVMLDRGLIVFSVHTYILYSSGGSFSSDSTFQLILWIIWEIFSTTLSAVFFVSLAAILFDHYQKTVNQ